MKMKKRFLLLCPKNKKKEQELSLFLSDKFGPFIVQLWVVVVASVPRFSTVNILLGAEVVQYTLHIIVVIM